MCYFGGGHPLKPPCWLPLLAGGPHSPNQCPERLAAGRLQALPWTGCTVVTELGLCGDVRDSPNGIRLRYSTLLHVLSLPLLPPPTLSFYCITISIIFFSK